MALVAATLGTQLSSMGPVNTEAEAIASFCNAFVIYFSTAMAGAIPVTPAISGTPKTSMNAAMTGLSTTGSVKIQAGIDAFWVAMMASPTLYFPSALLIVKPIPLSGLSPLLDVVFTANTSGNVALASAWNDIASTIHTANLGGMATIPMPTPTPTAIL